jgi:ParB family chromosome partitioning protein
LEALAASIAASGLMQPIVVRPAPDGAGQYEVIAGERRWRALERLGKQEAPVIVRTVGDQEAAELGLVENLQREDLNPMDRAAALRRLADEFGLTHQNLAARIGLDRATVTNLLRLTELDPETAGLVREGALSAGHARVLVGISDVARRCGLAALAAREGWSVRHLEERARDASVPRGTSARRTSATQSAHAARLERQLQEHLGTRVSLRLTRKKGVGELRIRFFSLDEFDGIMQRMGFRGDEGQLRV